MCGSFFPSLYLHVKALIRLLPPVALSLLSQEIMRDRYHEPREQPRRPRATNLEIQKWVARQHGFVPETAWIEHCRGLCITPAEGAGMASNPCPPEYQTAIRQALAHFGVLPT